MCKNTINNTILNILLIFCCNILNTLKRKYMLNLRSSDKTSKTLFHCTSPHLYSMGSFLSVRPLNQQWSQLTVRFYSKWYCAKSGVSVLARRFRFASNKYIVCESANVKLCQYQVMISNRYLRKLMSTNFFPSRLKVFYN